MNKILTERIYPHMGAFAAALTIIQIVPLKEIILGLIFVLSEMWIYIAYPVSEFLFGWILTLFGFTTMPVSVKNYTILGILVLGGHIRIRLRYGDQIPDLKKKEILDGFLAFFMWPLFFLLTIYRLINGIKIIETIETKAPMVPNNSWGKIKQRFFIRVSSEKETTIARNVTWEYALIFLMPFIYFFIFLTISFIALILGVTDIQIQHTAALLES